jgi:hypothetical protein
MKNKNILMVLTFIVFIIVGGYIYSKRQIPDGDGITNGETNAGDYDNLNSEIIKFISDFDSDALNVTLPDELTIELFELDPENEDLGEIL